MKREKKPKKPPAPIRCWRPGCSGQLQVRADGARECSHCKMIVRGGR